MKVAIAGGSGFIGKALTEDLLKDGHHVFILTRSKSKVSTMKNVTAVQWLTPGATPETELEGIDAIVNLAGENLSNGRWTTDRKELILNSRIQSTKEIVRIIEALTIKPSVLVNGSAIGFYGTSLTEKFTEFSEEPGTDFLATVVKEWERAAAQITKEVRVVYARFGMVLDGNEGALKKMLLPFQLGLGGNLGSGEQWMSWVHITDVVKAIKFCIETDLIKGPVNVTAPTPVKMKVFGKALATVLHRPYWAPVPGFVLKGALGEMSILVLEGQHVTPVKLQESNYNFEYPVLTSALENLLGK